MWYVQRNPRVLTKLKSLAARISGDFIGGSHIMPAQDSSYETESKVNMSELREAVRKVFDYKPSDRSVSSRPKHRKPKQKSDSSEASQGDPQAS